jgi:hypothetical protein
MKTAFEIFRTFRRMGTPIAECPEFWRPQWAGNSQYGYAIGFFPTRKQAVRAVLEFYSSRMHLIRQ